MIQNLSLEDVTENLAGHSFCRAHRSRYNCLLTIEELGILASIINPRKLTEEEQHELILMPAPLYVIDKNGVYVASDMAKGLKYDLYE